MSSLKQGLHKICLGLALAPILAIAQDQELKPVSLPQPQVTGGKPLMNALATRQTVREMQPRPLPRQTLANLLWAAFGINRPEQGRRTAPSAMNSQEIDLYVALPEGLYLYEPQARQLKPVLRIDLREKFGQTFSKDASLVLVYVADLPRLAKAKPEVRTYYAAFDAGCISQNVSLFCASEGLATVVHDLNRSALARELGLKPEQHIVMAQAVGFPGTDLAPAPTLNLNPDLHLNSPPAPNR